MRRGKYNVAAKKDRTYNGVVYMSKHEMNVRKHLELLMKAKDPNERIISIKEQVKIPVIINKVKCFTYIADFEAKYASGRIEIIDAKGVKTAIYSLKKKVLSALYGITIKEIYAKDI